MQFPEKYGGGGLGTMDVCIAYEELCKVDSTLAEPITSA
ncbi:MAG TPA: acyl-CoA dehydrogenase family protein, partial [Halobacteria archaeon]|nr:acyl-CoA dehydrogenase family protein [Halobacteria archaeon]